VFGLVIMLSGVLLFGFLTWFFIPRLRLNSELTKKTKSEYSHSYFKKLGHVKVLFLQIGLAPILALGMTFVFWQGWSSLVNFVAS